MTGEQSVLVFGALCLVLFVMMVSRGPKKKTVEKAREGATAAMARNAKGRSAKNRAERRAR